MVNTAFMQDKTSKIQEELIQTIQNEYVNWLMEKNDDQSNANDLDLPTYDSLLNPSQIDVTNNLTSVNTLHPNCEFYNYKFKITNSQAVVEFTVGNKQKSAFLEKKDGKWKLICCADIAPNL
jgi:hypothetical protein